MSSAYLSSRLRSFGYAISGLKTLLQTQPNAWIHALATVLVVVAGLAFGISLVEWALVVLAMAAVWAAEAMNTAMEFLVDLASLEQHPLAGKAKDVAAGGVLAAAIGAAVVGVLVFSPYIKKLLS